MTFHTVDWWQWVMIAFMWLLFLAFCGFLIDMRSIPGQLRDIMLQMAGKSSKVRIATPRASRRPPPNKSPKPAPKKSTKLSSLLDPQTDNNGAEKLEKKPKTVRHVDNIKKGEDCIDLFDWIDDDMSATASEKRTSVKHRDTEEEVDEKGDIKLQICE